MTDWHGKRYITSKKLLEKLLIEEEEKKQKTATKFKAIEDAIVDDGSENKKVREWDKLKPRHMPSLEEILEPFELPEDFFKQYTLREGSIFVVTGIQIVTAVFIGCLVLTMVQYPESMDEFWKEKFRNDFDYYFEGANKKLINTLSSTWKPITCFTIFVKFLYLITGFITWYALSKKHIDPKWYMPWLYMTGFFLCILLFIMLVIGVADIIYVCYRDLDITNDIFPICVIGLYAYFWYFCFSVVLAHYKRRRIVKYWRDYYNEHGDGPYASVIAAAENNADFGEN